jgi:hypothetical protein
MKIKITENIQFDPCIDDYKTFGSLAKALAYKHEQSWCNSPLYVRFESGRSDIMFGFMHNGGWYWVEDSKLTEADQYIRDQIRREDCSSIIVEEDVQFDVLTGKLYDTFDEALIAVQDSKGETSIFAVFGSHRESFKIGDWLGGEWHRVDGQCLDEMQSDIVDEIRYSSTIVD